MPELYIYTKDTSNACVLECRGVCYSLLRVFRVFIKKWARRSMPWQSEPARVHQIKVALAEARLEARQRGTGP